MTIPIQRRWWRNWCLLHIMDEGLQSLQRLLHAIKLVTDKGKDKLRLRLIELWQETLFLLHEFSGDPFIASGKDGYLLLAIFAFFIIEWLCHYWLLSYKTLRN